MERAKFLLLLVVFAAFGWVVLFQGTQPVQSSALPGITGFTMTPTPEHVKPSLTPVPPIITPAPPTLPPPPHRDVTPDAPLIIPVTGTDKTAGNAGIVNIGLVVLAFGLIAAGISLRKPKK